MGIEVTDEAAELLRSSLRLLAANNPEAGVRVGASPGLGGGVNIQVEVAERPLASESVVEENGIRIFLDPRVTEVMPEAIVAVEPQHQTVVVRPAEPE